MSYEKTLNTIRENDELERENAELHEKLAAVTRQRDVMLARLGLTQLLPVDERAIKALTLAEELTRVARVDHRFKTRHCHWCGSDKSIDGEIFVHEPNCKWKLFRDMVVDPPESER